MLWALFLGSIVLLLALDLGVFHRRDGVETLAAATRWSAFWIALGLGFAGVVYWTYRAGLFGQRLGELSPGPEAGGAAALQYLTAYLLEKSLSVDNLFVIAVVFDSFAVPRAYRHRVLFWGIVGALVLRAAMILGGVWALTSFGFLFPLFGVYLAYAALKLLRAEEGPQGPGRLGRWLRRALPIAEGDHGPRFTVRQGGRLQLTTLALALIAVEWTDVVFAVDSVPAVLSVTSEPFVAFSSNVFAILGLRSLFFVLEALTDRFSRLRYALALILLFIAVEMGLHGIFEIPNAVSLATVATLLIGGVLASRRWPEAARSAPSAVTPIPPDV